MSTIDTVRELISEDIKSENGSLSNMDKLQLTILTEQAESQKIMSEHLWWLALLAKIILVIIVLQTFFLAVFFA